MARKASEDNTSHMIGRNAPAFSLPDQNGKVHSLADYRGQHIVLFFYPKDDTPGFGFTQ